MVAPSSNPRVPIKLKLNLGGRVTLPVPSTPVSQPGDSETGKKGKAQAVDDEPASEAEGTLPVTQTSNGTNKGGNNTSKAPTTATSTPTIIQLKTDMDDQPQAGPSRPRSRSRSATPHKPPAILGHEVATAATATDPSPTPQTPTPAAVRPRGRPSSGKRTAKFTPKSRLNRSKNTARPSAIPSHLISETSTPSRPTAPLPETPGPYATPIKHDSSEATSPDPISLPLSPSAYSGDVTSTPQGEGYFDTPTTGRGRGGGRWMRVKRPLKELLNRIMLEIRKKDDYALFEEPVNLEAFPDYLGVIGGEDKMMDMSTMQSKVDNGEYQSIDQIEADLRTLVTAAQTYNPPGTIPYNSASRILTIGMKHIDRSRPLVRTPSPSPTRISATPFRGGSVFSGREGTAALDDNRKALEDLPPLSYIPEQMLDFPPNSLQALAVGWNLNGGKRVHAKRVVRSREKFAGKWRHWDMDGTRDVAEMDDIADLTDNWRVRKGEELRKITDWRLLRKNGGAWWESDTSLAGPSSVPGQVPVPYVAYAPRRDKVSERELGPMAWGLYPEIDAEITFLRKRAGLPNADDSEILSEHVRPAFPRPKRGSVPPPPNLVNIYDTYSHNRAAGDWVRDMCTGDTRGEAYLTSVDRFVQGAVKVASHSTTPSTSSAKAEEDTKAEVVSGDNEGDKMPLDEYVFKHYHDGLLSSGVRAIASDIHRTLTTRGEKPSWLVESARHAYARLALREMTSPANPMDIKPLLRQESDFLHQGVGGKAGVKEGLDWVGREIVKLDKELRERLDTERERKQLQAQQASASASAVEGKRKREMDVNVDVDAVADESRKKVKIEVTESAGSSPLSTAPGSPELNANARVNGSQAPPAARPGAPGSQSATSSAPSNGAGDLGDTPSLKQMRLELVALSKFYPLPALKRMSKSDAARLLPPNVRALMVAPEPQPQQKGR